MQKDYLGFVFDGINKILSQHANFFESMGMDLFRSFAVILLVWFGIQSALSSAEGGGGFHWGRSSLTRASIGLAVGFLLAGLTTRLLSTLIHGVTALDPLTYTAVSVIMLLVIVVASYVPARRAARIDPVSALRDS